MIWILSVFLQQMRTHSHNLHLNEYILDDAEQQFVFELAISILEFTNKIPLFGNSFSVYDVKIQFIYLIIQKVCFQVVLLVCFFEFLTQKPWWEIHHTAKSLIILFDTSATPLCLEVHYSRKTA